MLRFCFAERNVRVGPSRRLFKRGHTMRFEWLALLAYKRLTKAPHESSVEIREIARLPHWRGKTPSNISADVRRYLRDFERRRLRIIVAESVWAGPYRLDVAPSKVAFDIPLDEVRRRLRLVDAAAIGSQDVYRQFTWRYVQAQTFIYEGRLRSQGQEQKTSAYRICRQLAAWTRCPTNLRLLACIAAVNVQYRLGLFETAGQTLRSYRSLFKRATDESLKSRFYLAISWGQHRRASGAEANMRTESGLNAAAAFAGAAGDRTALGELSERIGGFHTKNGRHRESINTYLQALEYFLVAGNFDRVQACCCNIGSIMHRLDLPYYREARAWLYLSLRISHWMHLGRDGAHAEVILAKINIEENRRQSARRWIQKAFRVAQNAPNPLDYADATLIDALWHQSFGKLDAEKQSLIEAVVRYRSLHNFNLAQKENYIKHKFPTIWKEVFEKAQAERRRHRFGVVKRKQ